MAITPIRRSLDGLSPWDLEAVQRFAIQRANDDVLRHARVRPRLLLVCQDHLEEVDLDADLDGDPIAAFMALGSRDDVEHRILWGCVPVEDQRAAWVFGAANDEERTWWNAMRLFTRLPGGLGSAEASWDLSFGIHLRHPAGPVTTLARDAPPLVLLPAVEPPMPKIGTRVDPAPPGAVVPTDPIEASNVISQLGFEVGVARNGLDGVLLFLFRGRTLERWHLQGEIPCGLDDLVRAACAHGDAVSAAVALRLDLFDASGSIRRAVKMTSEAGGQRWERILTIVYDQEHGDEPVEFQVFGTAPTAAGTDGWIGVAPITELEIFALGTSGEA
ncbi:MAG: hypothetical protein H6735_24245 [Alphaproteobacteria bacterium]|nr:hypothetical protein [Alphaproteobacteria bacterium]